MTDGGMEIFAKIATSLDAKISLENGESKWITCQESRDYVHKLRSSADIIATGIGTIIADDAQLSARFGETLYQDQPQRLVFDTNARTPIDAQILKNSQKATIVFHGSNAPLKNLQKLRANGAITKEIKLSREDGLNLHDAHLAIKEIGAKSLMIEAGSKLLTSFIEAGLVNRLYWFRAPIIIGNKGRNVFNGLNPSDLAHAKRLKLIDLEKVGSDILEIYEV